jgi:hypothetical protein
LHSRGHCLQSVDPNYRGERDEGFSGYGAAANSAKFAKDTRLGGRRRFDQTGGLSPQTKCGTTFSKAGPWVEAEGVALLRAIDEGIDQDHLKTVEEALRSVEIVENMFS